MGTSSIFSGNSRFSQDFQNIITREVNIASLPLTQLNDSLKALQTQSDDLKSIDTAFSDLQNALTGIQDSVSGGSFQATISDPTLVSASLGDGAMEGNYTIEVIDSGAYSKSLSTSSWVNRQNPPGQTRTYELWIGDKGNPANKILITPADNSAQAVAAAINAKASDRVRAVAMNVKDAANPDWRISLQGTVLDNVPLDIVDEGVSLQTQTAGHKAQYSIAGCAPVSSTSQSVEIATGVTVNLLKANAGHPVDVTVTRSTAALSEALTAFAEKYNTAVDALDKQRGQSKGSLSGQSVLYDLSGVLTKITTYSPNQGAVSGLRDLGLILGDDGHLRFNSLQLVATDFKYSTGVTAFLGSKGDSGFLKAANDALNSAENAASGSLKNAEAFVQTQIKDTSGRISAQQDLITSLQDSLLQQLSAADAAIAAIEQQYSYVANMFESMRVSSQQYQ